MAELGLSREKVPGPGREGFSGEEQGEMVGQLRLECGAGGGGGRREDVGNSHPKKEWWSAAKQRLWESV